MADVSGSGFGGRRPPGLLANAAKRKDGFVQLFLMAGVFMMSLRSLGQKHRLRASPTSAASATTSPSARGSSRTCSAGRPTPTRPAPSRPTSVASSPLILRPPPPRTSSALILLFSGLFYNTYV
ncbi:unnamed protein product [Miscanthus lutarioriparius]|uniref:Uncharacterized protein n=1 Tax=Miscanthus lutarioriparius TaxID=422564 RepID=A0A811MM95_9POAL|nr:unnamed protein product [Miscanthus lutarioriparius]